MGRTTAELLATRWAAAAAGWSDAERALALAAARDKQPLVGMSLWLRWGVALDVAPCSGLAIVAGTESEHGVPEPLADTEGRDVERGGFTRALAQSMPCHLIALRCVAGRRRRAGPGCVKGRLGPHHCMPLALH